MKGSPFKFLDAYDKEDKDIFFGRDAEVEALYQMTFQTNLILVYGMSGTGKTSLIRCGLANRFDSSDWFDIYIRRNQDLNVSFVKELKAKDRDQSFEEEFTLPEMVRSLYLDYLRPIYLIFDQFEELFILGSEDEYRTFIYTIKELLQAELPCKVMIIMREEYLAQLSEFEKVVPRLFDKRLRVEPMTRSNAREVIIGTARNPRVGIQLSDEEVADEILDSITEGVGRVQLTYLQVFMDRMYRIAAKRNADRIVFDSALVENVGRIEDVLEVFLEEQLDVFAKDIGPKQIALKWLRIFVTEKGTKVPMNYQEVIERMPELPEADVRRIFQFFLNNRILRPLDNNQYELTHDSIAYKVCRTPVVGVLMPTDLPDYELPVNPFLRFEPYNKEMASIFYGREEEIKELFDKVVNETQVRTTLVFGPVGVGKTSLIQAGLVPRLEQLFKTVVLQFSREFFEQPLFRKMLKEAPQEGERPILLELAFRWYRNKPNQEERKALIIDQFEELFIWIKDHDELVYFYQHIQYLMVSGWNTDLVMVVRDEFFAQLQDLEFYVPGILEEQMRVRHIDQQSAKQIVRNVSTYANLLIEDETVLDRIVQNVEEEDGKVNLTYLQLYMDKLYRTANQ